MISLNIQAPEKRVTRTDGALDVVEVFATIQGEGPFVGRPSVFIRLAGCNLQCPACDTDYTKGRTLYTVEQLLEEVNRTRASNFGAGYLPLVVLTGGEPFRQRCGPAVRGLLDLGYHVQVETNGTLMDESLIEEGVLGPTFPFTIVCSPKAGIRPSLAPYIDAYKYVIREGQVDSNDLLPTSSLLSDARPGRPPHGFGGTIYVQPCDEQDIQKNKINAEAAIHSCMQKGYTLCLQMHKIVGLP